MSETPTPAPSLSPAPEPSPTEFQSFPPAPAGESEERAAIREGWEAYNHVLDKFLRNPELADLTETQYVTEGDESNRIIDEIQLTREANVRLEGGMVFRDVHIGPIVPSSDGVPSVVVAYCFDPSRQVAVDIETGQPYPDPRTDTLRVEDTLRQGKDGKWRVALHENSEAPC